MEMVVSIIATLAIPFGLLAIAVITVMRWRSGQPVKTWQIVSSASAVAVWIAIFIILAQSRSAGGPGPAAPETTAQASPPAIAAPAVPNSPAAGAAPTVTPAAPPPLHSAWTYEVSSDAMHDAKGKIACTTSTDTVRLGWPYGSQTANLCIRKGPKFGLDAYVALSGDGQIMCSLWNCTVHVRFDKRPAQGFPATRASDGSSNIIFLNRTQRLIDELKKSSVTHVELEFFQAGVQVLTFDTAQLQWP